MFSRFAKVSRKKFRTAFLKRYSSALLGVMRWSRQKECSLIQSVLFGVSGYSEISQGFTQLRSAHYPTCPSRVSRAAHQLQDSWQRATLFAKYPRDPPRP